MVTQELLSLYGNVCGVMGSLDPQGQRDSLRSTELDDPSNMPMVANLLTSDSMSPEALAAAKSELEAIIMLEPVKVAKPAKEKKREKETQEEKNK